MDFGGINFRFKEDGTSYQCYALRKGVAIAGGLKLQESTVSEFEKLVGSTAKKGVAPNGRVRYELSNSTFTFMLFPQDDDSVVVKSVMITKK